MSVDLATLGLRLTNAQAIADAKATGAALDEMGVKGEAAAAKIAASSNPVTSAIRQQAVDYASLTARTQDFARAGANAAQISQMTGANLALAMAAVREYSGTIAKAEIDVGGLRAAQAQMAMANIVPGISSTTDATRKMTLAQIEAIAMNEKMAGGLNTTGAGVGRLRQSFASAIAMMTGISPIAARIASTLGVMVAGVGEVVLAMAAIGAVIWVWDKMTEGANKAAAAADAAAKKTTEALHAHVLGAGGQIGEDISGTLEKIQDLQRQRDMAASAMAALRGGSFQGFNLNPADRAVQVKALDDQIAMLKMAVKSDLTDMQLATVKGDVTNVTTPYDYAMKRGQSLSGFYSEAMAAEVKLTALAKSGTDDVKNAALDALGKIRAVLDHLALVKKGLAEAPSQIFGMESGVAVGGMKQTTSNLLAAIQSGGTHGQDISLFVDQINSLGNLLSTASTQAKGSSKTEIQGLLDSVTLLMDAVNMAAATTPAQREATAASVRNRATLTGTASAGAVADVDAQKKYGQSLADREAALRLPAAFDAVREAALKLGEGMRSAKERLQLTRESWRPGNIVGGIETGATEGLATALQSFTPAGITASLVTTGINYIISGFADLASSLFNSGAKAREFALQMKTMQDSLAQAIASFQHNDFAAALAGAASQQDALIKQAWDTYGTVVYIIKHGTDDLTKALAQIGVGLETSTLILQQHQQYAQEDLVVRMMRATGNSVGADLLAFKESQQREMDAAKISHASGSVADALYLNTLQTLQNNELLAYQNGLLASALRNTPTGFYAEKYAGDFATPRAGVGPATPVPGGPIILNFATGALQVDGQGVVTAVVSRIDRKAAGTGGAGSSRAAALELM